MGAPRRVLKGKALATVPFSFEVYPPRSSDAAPALFEAIDKLSSLGPRFISVTFGAGGSDTKNSIEVLDYILKKDVRALAHLTCAGTTRSSIEKLISEFEAAGVSDFLALRGDLPAGQEQLPEEALSTAADLVSILKKRSGSIGEIAVAAFPNGHPESGIERSDIDALLAKQAAGADYAITQLFFYANDYFDFVSLARARGVNIPILPGIMPITSAKRLERVLELTGERNPIELSDALSTAQNNSERIEIGIDWAAKLVSELISGGAPGVHLYAFNEHERVTEVLRRAELV
ncbi:MAG: 5,10-methylenetetrahydrofolate reductase [Actinobacteria bacterium]|nr:5,10-methylenetetrahydrofolate reductase [Actinomycetota bacterium]